MKSLNDSATFLARRSCRSNNHQQLKLKKIDIDPGQLSKRTKRSTQISASMNPETANRVYLTQSNADYGKQPFVKMNRFKNLINMYHESANQRINNASTMTNQKEQIKREIINKKGDSRLSQCSETFDREKLSRSSIIHQDKESKLKLSKRMGSRKVQRRNRRNLSYALQMNQSINRNDFKQSTQTINKKNCQQTNRQSQTNTKDNKTVDRQDDIEDVVQKIINTQSAINANSDANLEKILNEFNIKNESQLNKFLLQNQYMATLFKSTSHFKNLALGTRIPITEYDRTFRSHQTIDNISFRASNYQCLPELHLKKPSIKNLQTSNCWDYYQKPIVSVPSCIPQVQQYAPIEQITYKTSYQHAFSNLKSKPKQAQSQKPFGETLIQGSQFRGTTQYNRAFKQLPEKLIKSQRLNDKFNQLLYNKHKNGDSHNTFTTKGFQLLRTAYGQQFTPKQPYNKSISILNQSLMVAPNSQSIQDVKVPISMYQTSTNKAYKIQDSGKTKRKTVTPWKYHLLCQLQALISMDKQKNKEKEKEKTKISCL